MNVLILNCAHRLSLFVLHDIKFPANWIPKKKICTCYRG